MILIFFLKSHTYTHFLFIYFYLFVCMFVSIQAHMYACAYTGMCGVWTITSGVIVRNVVPLFWDRASPWPGAHWLHGGAVWPGVPEPCLPGANVASVWRHTSFSVGFWGLSTNPRACKANYQLSRLLSLPSEFKKKKKGFYKICRT